MFCVKLFLLYHDCGRHSRKERPGENFARHPVLTTSIFAYTPEITTKKSRCFPLRRELFTFSTGFSTVFVKKRCSFPRGFPLFPPCFPHQKEQLPIPAVISSCIYWKVMGEKAVILPFIKKKVEAFSLLFTVSIGLRFVFSPDRNVQSLSFPQNKKFIFPVWKSRGKPQFSTNHAAEASRTLSRQQMQLSDAFPGALFPRYGQKNTRCNGSGY